MTSKLSCAIAAVSAALLVGVETGAVFGALDWALAYQFGLGEEVRTIGLALGVIPGVIAGGWIGREAWRAERRLAAGADVA
ncbi:MAG: hypothetical protein RIB45_01800 [Marivibrio sp.]|uniref:hypothetical protein n=1 Tax=Marivibrio sp. TaxID=2039719 RepID=UPI0032F08C4F